MMTLIYPKVRRNLTNYISISMVIPVSLNFVIYQFNRYLILYHNICRYYSTASFRMGLDYTLSDHWDETLESEPHLIGNFFGWIGIIALSLFIGNCGYKAMNEGQYNHPACSALGLKSNWNNTKCY